MFKQSPLLWLPLCSALLGCSQTVKYETNANTQGHTAATPVTQAANAKVLENLPFSDRQDFDDARRGLIAQDPALEIHKADGTSIWDMAQYDFVHDDPAAKQGKQGNTPASVNPSLWRQAALNNIHGLFKVAEGVYQLRGYDLANMSIIEGQSGWILVDPLTARETAAKALQFAQQHLGKKPIRAILFTHSHIDHFGGVQGILEQLSDEERAQLRLIAPKGFMEEATSENIIAGPAMSRRAMYMYGKRLARNERGHVGTGLGKGPAFGSFGLIEPNESVDDRTGTLDIDGVPFEFLNVPASEAPAEFTFYLPRQKAFCGAELVTHNLHNLYTLRGAKVRDAKLWSQYIETVRTRFTQTEVYFASHHWPMWGQANIDRFLTQQRDTYLYIHDQTVRLMNAGYTPNEIADTLQLPNSLNKSFHNRGYYGTVKHNARAVFQNYLGWFDANPAHLDPLPETESAKRTMAMMGGVETVLTKAQQDFDQAANAGAETGTRTYRWLAQLLNQALFAEPNNAEVKALLAKVYDQLGYQAEAAPWRDFYLTGAYELRHGGPKQGLNLADMKSVLQQTPVENFFDSMAVRLDGPAAEGKHLTVKISFTDLNQCYLLTLENAVLHHQPVPADTQADATLKLTHPLFVDMLIGKAGLKETLFSDDLEIDGSVLDLISFFSLLDKPDGTFDIVTP
ncbi:MAG: MBL fold metallo-hydrolase [Hahellaceae bacterium]|nr:MBL fold metallo-hydrolase [Hahellaceae bacterium]